MKSMKLIIPMLAILAFAFVLSGCPGKSMMADDGMQKEESMAGDGMEKDNMADDGMEKDKMMADDGMSKDK